MRRRKFSFDFHLLVLDHRFRTARFGHTGNGNCMCPFTAMIFFFALIGKQSKRRRRKRPRKENRTFMPKNTKNTEDSIAHWVIGSIQCEKMKKKIARLMAKTIDQ